MARCNECGKEYLTRECLKCKDKKKIMNIYPGTKNFQKRKEENKNLWKIAFFILSILSITIVLIKTSKIYELEKKEINNSIEIIRLKNKNKQLERKNYINKKLINDIKKINRELVHKSRNTHKVVPSRKHIKLKIKNYKKRNREIKYKERTQVREKNIYKKAKNIQYQRFSNNIKLISDSKVKINNNGKLIASRPIYGRYYPQAYGILNQGRNQISNIKCGIKKHRYGTVDECSMLISDNFDKVYLGKMDARSIQNFDYKNHMIECKYNKEYGIMHSCKIKIYRY